jgi:hypothetical protein
MLIIGVLCVVNFVSFRLECLPNTNATTLCINNTSHFSFHQQKAMPHCVMLGDGGSAAF